MTTSNVTTQGVRNEKYNIPTFEEFCVSIPLYAEFHMDNDKRPALFDLLTTQKTIDCFCVDCHLPSTFFCPATQLVSGQIALSGLGIFDLSDRVEMFIPSSAKASILWAKVNA